MTGDLWINKSTDPNLVGLQQCSISLIDLHQTLFSSFIQQSKSVKVA